MSWRKKKTSRQIKESNKNMSVNILKYVINTEKRGNKSSLFFKKLILKWQEKNKQMKECIAGQGMEALWISQFILPKQRSKKVSDNN